MIIGLNDNSVAVERLEGPDPQRQTAAYLNELPVQVVLDIEEGGR